MHTHSQVCLHLYIHIYRLLTNTCIYLYVENGEGCHVKAGEEPPQVKQVSVWALHAHAALPNSPGCLLPGAGKQAASCSPQKQQPPLWHLPFYQSSDKGKGWMWHARIDNSPLTQGVQDTSPCSRSSQSEKKQGKADCSKQWQSAMKTGLLLHINQALNLKGKQRVLDGTERL